MNRMSFTISYSLTSGSRQGQIFETAWRLQHGQNIYEGVE